MSFDFRDIWGKGVPLVGVPSREAGSLYEAATGGPPSLAKMVPVFKWDAKYVWVFLKTPGGPILAGLKHTEVKKYAKQIYAPGGYIKYAGKLDPYVYSGPQNIYPEDWVGAGAGLGGVSDSTGDTPESPPFSPHPQGWEITGALDPYRLPVVRHKKTGYVGTWLPSGQVAKWEHADQAYQPLKLTKMGVVPAKKAAVPLMQSGTPWIAVLNKVMAHLVDGGPKSIVSKRAVSDGQVPFVRGPGAVTVEPTPGYGPGVLMSAEVSGKAGGAAAVAALRLRTSGYTLVVYNHGEVKLIGYAEEGSQEELDSIAGGGTPSWAVQGAVSSDTPPLPTDLTEILVTAARALIAVEGADDSRTLINTFFHDDLAGSYIAEVESPTEGDVSPTMVASFLKKVTMHGARYSRTSHSFVGTVRILLLAGPDAYNLRVLDPRSGEVLAGKLGTLADMQTWHSGAPVGGISTVPDAGPSTFSEKEARAWQYEAIRTLVGDGSVTAPINELLKNHGSDTAGPYYFTGINSSEDWKTTVYGEAIYRMTAWGVFKDRVTATVINSIQLYLDVRNTHATPIYALDLISAATIQSEMERIGPLTDLDKWKATAHANSEVATGVSASGIPVPKHCTIVSTSPKVLADTALGDSISRNSDGTWTITPTYRMAMNGAVYPTSFIPISSKNPGYPGSLLGSFYGTADHTLLENSIIIDPKGEVVWSAKGGSKPVLIQAYYIPPSAELQAKMGAHGSELQVDIPEFVLDALPSKLMLTSPEWVSDSVDGGAVAYTHIKGQWAGTLPAEVDVAPLRTKVVVKSGELVSGYVKSGSHVLWTLSMGIVGVASPKALQTTAPAPVEDPHPNSPDGWKLAVPVLPDGVQILPDAKWKKTTAHKQHRFVTENAVWVGKHPKSADMAPIEIGMFLWQGSGAVDDAWVDVGGITAWCTEDGYTHGWGDPAIGAVPDGGVKTSYAATPAADGHTSLEVQEIVQALLPSAVKTLPEAPRNWQYNEKTTVWSLSSTFATWVGESSIGPAPAARILVGFSDDGDGDHVLLLQVRVSTSIKNPTSLLGWSLDKHYEYGFGPPEAPGGKTALPSLAALVNKALPPFVALSPDPLWVSVGDTPHGKKYHTSDVLFHAAAPWGDAPPLHTTVIAWTDPEESGKLSQVDLLVTSPDDVTAVAWTLDKGWKSGFGPLANNAGSPASSTAPPTDVGDGIIAKPVPSLLEVFPPQLDIPAGAIWKSKKSKDGKRFRWTSHTVGWKGTVPESGANSPVMAQVLNNVGSPSVAVGARIVVADELAWSTGSSYQPGFGQGNPLILDDALVAITAVLPAHVDIVSWDRKVSADGDIIRWLGTPGTWGGMGIQVKVLAYFQKEVLVKVVVQYAQGGARLWSSMDGYESGYGPPAAGVSHDTEKTPNILSNITTSSEVAAAVQSVLPPTIYVAASAGWTPLIYGDVTKWSTLYHADVDVKGVTIIANIVATTDTGTLINVSVDTQNGATVWEWIPGVSTFFGKYKSKSIPDAGAGIYVDLASEHVQALVKAMVPAAVKLAEDAQWVKEGLWWRCKDLTWVGAQPEQPGSADAYILTRIEHGKVYRLNVRVGGKAAWKATPSGEAYNTAAGFGPPGATFAHVPTEPSIAPAEFGAQLQSKTPKPPTPAEVVAQSKSKLPTLSSLKLVAGKGDTLGGAGKKDVYTDGTTEYIWKPSVAKGSNKVEPFRAAAQSAFSTFATAVRPEHIRIGLDIDDKQQLGTLQEVVALGDPKDLVGIKPADLTDQEKLDVATEHMLDWVMSQHDSHPGNLVRTADGRILSIDKEQGWKHFKDDRLAIDYHPNAVYGEKEPFYNTFWRDYQSGKVDFDPMALSGALAKIEAIDTGAYLVGVRQYADLVIKNSAERSAFVEEAVTRKLNTRRDFEHFLSGVMGEREGEPGTFTFELGWISDKDEGKQKYIEKSFSAEGYGKTLGIKAAPHDPTTGANPKNEVPNPDWLALKIDVGISQEKLEDFLEEYGIELVQPIFPGPHKHIAIVTKKSFQGATITKLVPKEDAFKHPSATAKYWPDVAVAPKAPGNVEILEDLSETVLGRHGHRVTSDGVTLEGQSAKVARWRDAQGKVYYRIAFKLRRKHWKYLKGGDAMTYYFKKGQYLPEKDLYVEVGGHSDHANGKEFSIPTGGGAVTVFIATDEARYAYMGGVYIHMPATVKNPLQVAKAALNKVNKGLGTAVFKPLSEEDEQLMKLSRLYWAKEPQKSDALKENERTVANLTQLLQGKVTKEEYALIESAEVYPGYHTQVLPGRWKEMGNGKVRFLFNGIKNQEGAVSILRTGLMGIHERNLAGIRKFGGSYDPDVGTGSGDGSLARVITENALPARNFSSHMFHGIAQVLIHPKAMDRLDTYMHPSDEFGKCRGDSPVWQNRKSVEKRVASLAGSYSTGNEISFRRGVDRKYLLRMTTGSNEVREAVIADALEKGVTEVNGVPLTDFIVVCSSLQEAYDKYVKPLGLRG